MKSDDGKRASVATCVPEKDWRDLCEQAERLRRWMLTAALPLWADAGIHDSGAAWEALDFEGAPVPDDDVRVRVQARQLYSFALAHRLGWEPDRCTGIVSRLFDVLTDACRRPDGLYGRRISLSKQRLTDDTPDLYDNAFSLLALTSAREVLGPEPVQPAIDNLLQSIDAGLKRDGDKGYCEFLPAPEQRSQNPHMHLYESTLALADVTGCEDVRGRAERLFAFVQCCFFDDAEAIVHEHRQSPNREDEKFFEPGHSMEWVWLLGWRSRLYDLRFPVFAHVLYARALKTLDRDGRASMRASIADDSLLDPTQRLWSQTETLRAHLAIAELGDDKMRRDAVAAAIKCCEGILKDWLGPAVWGGWLDHVDSDRQLIATDIPGSTGYHLFGAIAELLRIVELD